MSEFNPKIGFEAEVIFLANGYPKLVEAAEERKFLWEDHDEEIPTFMKRIIADDLSEYLGEKVVASRETPTSPPAKRWSIGGEYSIVATDFFNSVVCVGEIKTPPLPHNQALTALDAIIDFCKQHKAATHSATGLHVSIDVPTDRYRGSLADPIVLALSLDEEEILRKFDRHGSNGLVPQTESFIVEMAAAIIDGNRQAFDYFFLLHHLGKDKRFGINFGKLDYGFIEFRHCGGPKYLRQKTTIKATTRQYLKAIAASHHYELRHKVIEERLRVDVEAVVDIMDKMSFKEVEGGEFSSSCSWDGEINGRKVVSIFQHSPASFSAFPNIDILDNPRQAISHAWISGLEVDGVTKAKALAALTWLRNKNLFSA